jgi:hypothetical protein
MKLTIFLIYGILFSIAFLLFATIWHFQMQDVYFVCRDKGLVSDFLPPFVSEGTTGEFFIKPPHVIYTIWTVYMALVVLVPGVAAWLLTKLYDRALKKSWM